jgi:RimJ/RimL family protein N-acetyltransferase
LILKKAAYSDWQLLLEWRNDLITRTNSHSMESVNEETHKNWLKVILEDASRQLFIAYDNDVAVGTARADFDKEDNSYELSWTISPGQRGKGVGKKMIRLLAEQLNTKVKAEVKKGNTASVKIAEFAGMTFKNETDDVLYFSNF